MNDSNAKEIESIRKVPWHNIVNRFLKWKLIRAGRDPERYELAVLVLRLRFLILHLRFTIHGQTYKTEPLPSQNHYINNQTNL